MDLSARIRETRELGDRERQNLGGLFVRLTDGYTHYDVAAERGPQTVVLVHGFSVPYFIWDPTVGALAEAGLRTIRYDLFGRGLSDRPDVAYDLPMFVRQLAELLDALHQNKVDIIGLSMGGIIAAAFAVAFPARIRKIALIDPAGVKPIALGFLYRLAVIPGLSDLVFGIFGTDYMLAKVGSDFYGAELVEQFRERYRPQMAFRGFKKAILSTVRHNMLGNHARIYSQLGGQETPVLIIWGEKDATVPFEHSTTLRELIPHAEFMAVPECGHIPHFERPEIVNPRLVEFLR